MNVCGVELGNTSEAFRAECEARYVLSKSYAERDKFLVLVRQRRGAGALMALGEMTRKIEPAYVLGLPTKIQRQNYLSSLAFRYGDMPAERLKSAILKLHESRKLGVDQS